MKRPQSAFTKLDDQSANSTKINFQRPMSGASDQTLRFSNSNIDQMIAKGNYSLQLNNLEDSIQLYEQAFKLAAHQLTSIKLAKLLEDVVNSLLQWLKNCNDNFLGQKVVNQLLIWCQIQQSYEDTIPIKCPIMLQIKVLNAYGNFLRVLCKFDESRNYLNLALDMLQQYKAGQSIDDVVGQCYVYMSTTSLYQQNYQNAIQEAQSAIQHLQQALLISNPDQDVNQNICDAYINLAIAKEHEKLFQEAHYNYYSSLIFAQQNLDEVKQGYIQQIYDQFLSRQATHLQKLSTTQLNKFRVQQKPKTTVKQPFVEIVRNMQQNPLTQTFLKKQSRIIQSQDRKRNKQEQRSLIKFQPYLTPMSQSKSVNVLKPHSPKRNQIEKMMTSQNGIKIVRLNGTNRSLTKNSQVLQKSFSQTTKYQSQYAQQKNNFQTEEEQTIQVHPSQIIQYLEALITKSKIQKSQNILILHSIPNMTLPSVQLANGLQKIYQGMLVCFQFKQENIVYMQFIASEINYTDAKQTQLLISLSINVSDIINQLSQNRDPIQIKLFFIHFIQEYLKYVKIDQVKQTFTLSSNFNNQIGLTLFMSVDNIPLMIQLKNDYEYLLLISEQQQTQEDIYPILSCKSSEDIQPLMSTQHRDEFDIQPILGVVEESQINQDYSDDFEPTISQPLQKYNTMEKFTIQIASEDQKNKEVIEVYAGQQQDQEDVELKNAALLIQKKFRAKKAHEL